MFFRWLFGEVTLEQNWTPKIGSSVFANLRPVEVSVGLSVASRGFEGDNDAPSPHLFHCHFRVDRFTAVSMVCPGGLRGVSVQVEAAQCRAVQHTAAQRTAVQRSVVPPEGLTFRVFLVFFGIVSWNRGSLKAPDQPECAFGLWQYLVRASAASTHRPSTLSPSSPSTRPRQSTSENTNKKSHRKHTQHTHTRNEH